MASCKLKPDSCLVAVALVDSAVFRFFGANSFSFGFVV